MTSNAGIHTTPPQEGTGIHGATTGLEEVLRVFARGPALAAALSQLYGVTPPVLIRPGMRLPRSGADGQTVDALVDAATGVVWRFRFTPLIGLPYQWAGLAAPAGLYSFSGSNTNCASAVFVSLANSPSVIAPFAGDYMVHFGVQPNAASASPVTSQAQVFAGGVLFPNGGIVSYDSTAGANENKTGWTKVTGLAAGATITLQYAVVAGNINFANRWISVTPIRVAGG